MIQINAMPSNEKRPYEHLIPLIEALLEDGNETTTSEMFHRDRDGWRCDLKKPIDFGLLRQTFALPPSIELSEKNNSIFCKNTWVEIKGGPREI